MSGNHDTDGMSEVFQYVYNIVVHILCYYISTSKHSPISQANMP